MMRRYSRGIGRAREGGCMHRLGLLLEDKGLESKPLKCSVELGFRVSIVESKPLLFSSRDLCLNELEIS